MAENLSKNTETLFSGPPSAPADNTLSSLGGFSTSGSGFGWDISQSEKDAIMRQIHPIFLTTHTDDKPQVIALSNFDKFLNFLRLCLEWFLKFVDIIIDAAIQIARLGVWVVAITWVLIVVTLMTNTTDKFIDLLNESVFKAFGWETRIEKVPTETADATQGVPLESQTLTDESTLNDAEKLAARKARIEAARKATESADIPATNN